jgi:hypothetical protein
MIHEIGRGIKELLVVERGTYRVQPPSIVAVVVVRVIMNSYIYEIVN